MPYQLYWRAGSGSMVVEAALLMAGASYTLIGVPTKAEQTGEAFLKVNPAGKIPILVTPKGQTIIESVAILLALDELHKEAALLPAYGSPERATALQWLAFLAASTYPAALRFYYPHRFTTDQSPEAIACVKASGAKAMNHDFAILAAAVKGPFLLGETLTIADVYLAMVADWYDPAMEIPALQKLKTEMLKNAAVKSAWDNHGFAP
ncbi:MAG: glutathione S-transferase family protein [Notoacmeibacter sp.]